jgi:hypothetical protein
MPHFADSSASRSPRQGSGIERRFSKEEGDLETACSRHFFSRSSSYRTNSMGGCMDSSASSSYRCSCLHRIVWEVVQERRGEQR